MFILSMILTNFLDKIDDIRSGIGVKAEYLFLSLFLISLTEILISYYLIRKKVATSSLEHGLWNTILIQSIICIFTLFRYLDILYER